MNIVSPPLPIGSAAPAELARCRRDLSRRSKFPSEMRTPGRSTLNLARPWRFPAGHADSIRCRRHPRSNVQVPVQIALYRQDGSSYDNGTGVLRDLSYSGLRLGYVFLTRGRLLATSFAIHLRHAFESLGDETIAGLILRAPSSGSPDFGIEFLFPDSGAEARLRERR
jgi:hypothetical protein